jgi:hypothetical protein
MDEKPPAWAEIFTDGAKRTRTADPLPASAKNECNLQSA